VGGLPVAAAAAPPRAPVPDAPPPPAPPPPAPDEFADEASNFAVETFTPSDEKAGEAPVVIDAPPLAPQDHGSGAAVKFEPGEPEKNVATVAARRAQQKYSDRKQRRSALRQIANMPVLITVLVLIVLGALQWRVALVRQFPQTASLFALIGMPVNLRGLSFMDVKSRGEFVDGAMVLVVEGTIVNLTDDELRDVRLRVRDMFLWRNERRPGEDDFSRAEEFVVRGPVPPRGALAFTAPRSPLAPRSDGEYRTSVDVTSLTRQSVTALEGSCRLRAMKPGNAGRPVGWPIG